MLKSTKKPPRCASHIRFLPGLLGSSPGWWVKLFVQNEIQVVEGQGEAAVNPRLGSAQAAALKTARGTSKSLSQCHVFLSIPKLAKQPLHFLRRLLCAANNPLGCRGGHLPGPHLFEQCAFEFPTVYRAFLVDPATASVVRNARLGKSLRAPPGHVFPGLQAGPTRRLAERKAQRLQPGGIIAAPQFHVCKDGAVAAQAAG
jgi:hypothetical protein